MPFVVVGRPDDATSVFSVDVDNRGGARNAASHLAGLGRRRLALISAPSNTTAGIDRRSGYLEGVAGAGLSLDGRIREGDWTENSGRGAMQELLADNPDGVFAASDRMAIGAVRAISDAGLNCPRDVAVVSFDGLLHRSASPRLTSDSPPVREVGEQR